MKNFNLILCLFYLQFFSCSSSRSIGELFPFSTYKEFDLEGGYYPGTFLVIKKKTVQSPIITLEELDKVVCVKNIYKYSTPQNIPNTSLDRKKYFNQV